MAWPFLHSQVAPLVHVLCWTPPSGGSATCPRVPQLSHGLASVLFPLVNSRFMRHSSEPSLPRVYIPSAEWHSRVGQRGAPHVHGHAGLPGVSVAEPLFGDRRRFPVSGCSAAFVVTQMADGPEWSQKCTALAPSRQLRGALGCVLPTS